MYAVHAYFSSLFFFHSPFFGEDVHFEVPRDFRTLCFYLFDTDLIGKDTVLGKVSVIQFLRKNTFLNTFQL